MRLIDGCEEEDHTHMHAHRHRHIRDDVDAMGVCCREHKGIRGRRGNAAELAGEDGGAAQEHDDDVDSRKCAQNSQELSIIET